MRKIAIAMFLCLVVVGACSNAPLEKDDRTEHPANTNQTVTHNDEGNDTNAATNVEEAKPNEENSDGSNNTNHDVQREAHETSESVGEDAGDYHPKRMLRELGYDIFRAQHEENYEYLRSILANNASMNQKANTFYFDEIESPHESEFVQEEADNIEYRYIHENDNDIITVGFGIVDYETETSYTIDFQFVKEKKAWKMKDMDKNA